jgi:hypothetical protein
MLAAVQIEGVGEVLPWAEYWRLIYAACGHETMFSRTAHRLFEDADVEREVRTYYAQCLVCARPVPHMPRPGH